MHNILRNLNDVYGMDFEKCGVVVVAPKSSLFVACCNQCPEVFLEMTELMEHTKAEHFDTYDFEKPAMDVDVDADADRKQPTDKLPNWTVRFCDAEPNLSESDDDAKSAKCPKSSEAKLEHPSAGRKGATKPKQAARSARQTAFLMNIQTNALQRSTAKELAAKSIDSDGQVKKSKRKPQLYHCENCVLDYADYAEFLQHMRGHNPNFQPLECTQCDYITCDRGLMQRHFRCHTGERPRKCPHCTYAARDMYGLTRHLRLHTGEKRPFDCVVCKKRFNDATALERHKQIHNAAAGKQEPRTALVACKLCPKSFSSHTKLARHKRSCHPEEKSNKCAYCKYATTDKSKLQRHLVLHKAPSEFKCTYCTYGAKDRSSLMRHIRRFCLPTPKRSGTADTTAAAKE